MPHPDLFLHAAAQMKADPARAVVIEDSLPGVQGARAAGMRVHAYAADPLNDAAVLAEAGGILFSDMRALPEQLKIV
jgi:beta-phosphoglucomutase-like phosphatase (HAD superfamily)